tara:strand:- start:2158 stop:2442 length:285 start_codon:yes stop_codon:yes gene_type:complete
MTEKQMRQLTEMIIEAIDNKQRELDKEFYANIDNRVDIAYSPHPVDQAQSESERVLNKLHDLYSMQLKLISEEKFELAEEIKQTIRTIKENYNL